MANSSSAPGARPSWDEYFLGLMDEVAKRATCDRGKSGCVIVRNRRIIATGYVGSPPGFPHCDDAGHELRQVLDETGSTRQHCVRTIHAEQNAICQAARYGIPLEGADLYCRMEPCRTCALLVVSVGIRRVVAQRLYHAGQDTRRLFEHAGIELVVHDPQVETYPSQTNDS